MSINSSIDKSCLPFSIEELLCFQMQDYTMERCKLILEQQNKKGITTIPFYSELYPKYLLDILGDDAPLLIHISGDLDIFSESNRIAIIGSRKADDKGLKAAYQLAYKYASMGYVIVSGLALGCDTAAHKGCLQAGGKTIAVVASGLNITHPKCNKILQEEIADNGGAIITEYPFGIKANPTRLVERCRLQIGLSQEVIVAQSSPESGTMYAVQFARRYLGTKNIYAVEYDKYDENNLGNKYLIEQGIAKPITIE